MNSETLLSLAMTHSPVFFHESRSGIHQRNTSAIHRTFFHHFLAAITPVCLPGRRAAVRPSITTNKGECQLGGGCHGWSRRLVCAASPPPPVCHPPFGTHSVLSAWTGVCRWSCFHSAHSIMQEYKRGISSHGKHSPLWCTHGNIPKKYSTQKYFNTTGFVIPLPWKLIITQHKILPGYKRGLSRHGKRSSLWRTNSLLLKYCRKTYHVSGSATTLLRKIL